LERKAIKPKDGSTEKLSVISIFLSENVINCDYFFSGSLSNVIKCEKIAIFHSLRHFQNKLFFACHAESKCRLAESYQKFDSSDIFQSSLSGTSTAIKLYVL
jgi:hypothetical protein